MNAAATGPPVIGRAGVVFGYAVMVGLAAAAFVYVRSNGNGLVARDVVPAPHGIFGAFMFGAIIPSTSPLVGEIRHKLDDLLAVVFLPAGATPRRSVC